MHSKIFVRVWCCQIHICRNITNISTIIRYTFVNQQLIRCGILCCHPELNSDWYENKKHMSALHTACFVTKHRWCSDIHPKMFGDVRLMCDKYFSSRIMWCEIQIQWGFFDSRDVALSGGCQGKMERRSNVYLFHQKHASVNICPCK